MTTFILNDRLISSARRPGDTALDLIRIDEGLTATKAGCREGDCGACIVLWGRLQNGVLVYKPVNSCLLAIGELHGTHVVTLEGMNGEDLTPVQKALHDHHASQCGFCTPGIVNSLTAHFLTAERIDGESLTRALDGNLCRCTGYGSVKRALNALEKRYGNTVLPEKDRLRFAVEEGFIPHYFLEIAERLSVIAPQKKDPAPAEIHVGGGTDLLVQNFRRLPEAKFNFSSISSPEAVIEKREDFCYISGNASVADLMRSSVLSELVPEIRRTFPLISATALRERATVAGNIVNASPIADLAVFFLVLEAELMLSGKGGRRTVPLTRFFLGYKEKDLRPGEYIDALRFPVNSDVQPVHFEKVSKREHLDIASVNTAMRLEMDGDRVANIAISAGGVAPIPLLLRKTAAHFYKRPLTPTLIWESAEITNSEISPISDIRGSADYKRKLLHRLIESHFLELVPELFGKEVQG